MNDVNRNESNQEKGRQALGRVKKWIAKRDELGDYWEYERDGKVSRVVLTDKKVSSRQ